MEKITVYTKENCMPCKATIRHMGKIGLSFEQVSIEENPELITWFREEGLLEAPIVDTGEEKWSGFRPDKIKALGERALNETTKDIDVEGATS